MTVIRFVAPLLIAWFLAGCVAGGLPAGPVAGTRTLPLRDEARGRDLTSELWFAARPGSRTESFSPLPPVRAIEVARDAEPADSVSKRPLLVVSHGNWGTRFSQGWLAARLAVDGYVLVSVSHPGTMNGDQTAAGRGRLWDRSIDVSLVLDRLLADPVWAARIDAQRIGFVGHSFGGWAGVSLAGGRFDPERQRRFCLAHRQEDLYCRGSVEDDPAGVDASDAGRSYRDERLRAFYVMASGPAQGFDPQSLRSIQAPFLVDSALRDDVLGAEENSSLFARSIPSAREERRDWGHFAYVPECRPLLGPLLARQICLDPPGVDRARAHEAVYQAAREFFDRELGPR
jgi:predicted dienelactone hydrolase